MLVTQPLLLLNGDYTPTKIITVKKAFGLVSRGIAEFLEITDHGAYEFHNIGSWCELSEYKDEFERSQEEWVQTGNMRLILPRVAKLIKYFKKERLRVRLTRNTLYARDVGICQYCGCKLSTHDMTIDHVVPRAQGGITRWENVVLSCESCNMLKGSRTPAQAGMKLLREPVKPTHPIQTTSYRHDSWKNFIDYAYWNIDLK